MPSTRPPADSRFAAHQGRSAFYETYLLPVPVLYLYLSLYLCLYLHLYLFLPQRRVLRLVASALSVTALHHNRT